MYAHREVSDLVNELPEESDQFRFLRDACLAHLKGSLGLILAKSSVMRISIPIDLSSRSFIPLPKGIHLIVLIILLVWHFLPSVFALFYSSENKPSRWEIPLQYFRTGRWQFFQRSQRLPGSGNDKETQDTERTVLESIFFMEKKTKKTWIFPQSLTPHSRSQVFPYPRSSRSKTTWCFPALGSYYGDLPRWFFQHPVPDVRHPWYFAMLCRYTSVLPMSNPDNFVRDKWIRGSRRTSCDIRSLRSRVSDAEYGVLGGLTLKLSFPEFILDSRG